MKVLIDLTSLADNFSGIERFAMSIAKELIRHQEMDFVLVFKNEIHKEFLEKKKNVTNVVLKGKNKLLFNQFVLPYGISRIQADVYLFLAFPAPFFFFKKRVISAIHDVSCWDCPGSNKKHMIAYFKVLYRKVAMGKNPVITVSEFSKERIMEVLHVDEKRLWVIYNGLSEQLVAFGEETSQVDEVEKRLSKKSEVIQTYQLPDNYLLCLSTLEPRKNLKLLVRAYGELFLEGAIQAELVLAGRKGWMVDALLERVDPKVREHIHFTGFVEDEDLPYVYENAAMFVFPSIYEGFGIPPIEAMCMNTLVVSSDAASMPEVLGDAAYYFKNDDCAELKQQIKKVLDLSDAVRREQIIKGRQQALNYDWRASASRLAELLKNE